jgi:glucan phosphoethanolaminetransferase (alkaline phosphatase superfamily)
MKYFLQLFQPLRYNLIFSIISAILLTIPQVLFTDIGVKHLIKNSDFFILIGIFFFLSILSNKILIYILLSFIYFMFLIEILHFQYYKHSVLPSEIYKFFSDFSEVNDALGKEVWAMMAMPAFFVILIVILHFFLLKKMKLNFIKVAYVEWLLPVLFSVLIYNAASENVPGRAVKQNQHLVRSSFETFISFFGKYLPMKLSGKMTGGKLLPVPNKIPPTNASILLIINESMSAYHFGAFGYSVSTTPHIEKLHKNKLITLKKCVTSGSNTEIALLNLFFFIDTLRQFDQLYQGSHFLFKLAKESGFKTYYISTQSLEGGSSILGMMNHRYMDVVSLPHHRNPGMDTDKPEADSVVLRILDTILPRPEKKFIVVQLYGCHEPYHERYPENLKVFQNIHYKYNHTSHYDQALYYQSMLFEKIYHLSVKKSAQPLYVFHIPDHGECAGDEDIFGHNMFRKPVLTIPFIYYSVEVTNDTLEHYFNNQSLLITQKQVNVCIRRLLGYDYTYTPTNRYLTIGMDYMGYDGHVISEFNGDSVVWTRNAEELLSP